MKIIIKIFILIIFLYYSSMIAQANDFGFAGSTTIYDLNNDEWFFTDSSDALHPTLPASTFKILNSLIILEEKVVQDENEIIKWDGTVRGAGGVQIDAWNKDNDLKSAYKNSTVWFYVEAANRIGKPKYKEYLSKCEYGNGNLYEKDIDFWIKGDFAISPKNQIEFLKKLYKGNLPFSERSINIIKQIMVSERDNDIIFRDKTGWTSKDGKDIGWWVGYVTAKSNVIFFATRLIKDENDANPKFLKARKERTLNLLKELGKI